MSILIGLNTLFFRLIVGWHIFLDDVLDMNETLDLFSQTIDSFQFGFVKAIDHFGYDLWYYWWNFIPMSWYLPFLLTMSFLYFSLLEAVFVLIRRLSLRRWLSYYLFRLNFHCFYRRFYWFVLYKFCFWILHLNGKNINTLLSFFY